MGTDKQTNVYINVTYDRYNGSNVFCGITKASLLIGFATFLYASLNVLIIISLMEYHKEANI